MKRNIITITGMFGLGVIFYFTYTLFFNPTSADSNLLLSKDDLEKENFLHNKKAIIYLSTTADQDIDGEGFSFAVFIDQKGKAQALKMEGLELGSTAVYENSVFLEEKDKVRIVGEDYKEFPMKTAQYTGERTGFIENKNIFFSIYNSGFTQDGSGYLSDVRFGNKEKFQTDSIPFYIASSGIEGEKVNILTQDVDKNQFDLRQVTFDSSLEVDHLTMLDTPKNEFFNSLAPLLSDKKSYYLILSSVIDDFNEKTSLYRIAKDTYEQEVYDFIEYKDMKDLVSTIPYNFKNSAHIHQDVLYFINGLGDVYTFDTKNEEIQKKFSIENASKSKIRHNEETYFKDNSLYVLRYSDEKKEKYYLEEYNLDNGSRVNTLDITGFHDLLSSVQKKSIYSYDLKVLD